MTDLSIIERPVADFATIAPLWDDLLSRSEADPLFCSHSWLDTWWRHHAADFGLQAFVLEARADDELVGVAAFAHRRARVAPGITGTRVELLGNLWRTKGTAMSERTGFVVDSRYPATYEALAVHLLNRRGWAEVVVSHTDTSGPTYRALVGVAEARRLYHRATDEMTAYVLDLSEGFVPFLKRLSAKTRRRVYNERRKLAGAGELVWETAVAGQLDEFFGSLDELHTLRWGWPASEGRRGRMYREYAELAAARGTLSLGRLRIGDRVIAAAFDLRAGDCLYGIQKAADTQYSRAISPGFLMSGFNFEQACAQGIRRIDFLGGEGKNSDYKSKFGAEASHLACIQVVRQPVLAAGHRLFDRLGRDRLARLRERLRNPSGKQA